MLRVNVGLSRKLSRDYNSTGFSINLDGELTAPVSDPEAVIEQVKELYDLAEEALDRQVERVRSEEAIGSHDDAAKSRPQQERPTSHRPSTNCHPNGDGRGQSSRESVPTDGDAATTKQINYLITIGRRQRLSTKQLEEKIEEVLRRPIGLYDLSKRDAASVIDALTSEAVPAGDRR